MHHPILASKKAPAQISIEGVTLPVTGFVGFYDHYWNEQFSSTIGYSFVKMINSNGQGPSAFKMGDYAIANLIYTPHKDVILELQLQYLHHAGISAMVGPYQIRGFNFRSDLIFLKKILS